MQSRRTYILLIALSAVLTLDGCAWTKRTWNRVWSKGDDHAQQEEAKRQAEQDSSIVTGSEGDIPAPSEPRAAPATSEPVVGMPETQSQATKAPAAPAGDLPNATATPAPSAAPPAAAPAPAAAAPAEKSMTLQADSLFAFGKSKLSTAGKKKLDELAAQIAGMDKTALGSITVIGHADRIGQAERNQMISERRAQAVKTYLAGHGIDEAMINTEGRGSSEPLADCPGDKVTKKLIACLAQNRRVEVMIHGR